MISDDAYRRLEALGKKLLHDGDITPAGLRVLYSVIIEESDSRPAREMLPGSEKIPAPDRPDSTMYPIKKVRFTTDTTEM